MRTVSHEKNIIEVKGISFSYGNENVLGSISLEIHEGDYLGIVGPNGSGKTTLLKIILGLLKPSQGEITLFGQDINVFKDWSKIGYVPQKATSFDTHFPVTVQEVAMMGRYAKRGLFNAINNADYEKVKKALEEVGMWEYKNRLIGDLSGGQQQRVFIARALAGEPEVIFLDEPTTGIDRKTQDEFYELLRKLNEDLNMTLVLVSHDLERIVKESTHIACIDKTLICHASPKDFLRDTRSMSVFGQQVKIISNHHHE